MQIKNIIREISESECTLSHPNVLSNDKGSTPFETAPWRVIQCSHYEGWQVNMVQLITEYYEASAADEIPPMGISIGWQEPCVFLVTCWALDNRNTNKVCSTKEEADEVFEAYSRFMIKEASKEND